MPPSANRAEHLVCHLALPLATLDITEEFLAPEGYFSADGLYRSTAEELEGFEDIDIRFLPSSSSSQSSGMECGPFMTQAVIEDIERCTELKASLFDGMADNVNGCLKQGFL